MGQIVIGAPNYKYQQMSETPVGLFLRAENQRLVKISLENAASRRACMAILQPEKSRQWSYKCLQKNLRKINLPHANGIRFLMVSDSAAR